jgi:ankyrin repeat protein
LEVVKWLVENGADVTANDDNGKNAWDIANEYGESEIEEILSSCAFPFRISAKSVHRS